MDYCFRFWQHLYYFNVLRFALFFLKNVCIKTIFKYLKWNENNFCLLVSFNTDILFQFLTRLQYLWNCITHTLIQKVVLFQRTGFQHCKLCLCSKCITVLCTLIVYIRIDDNLEWRVVIIIYSRNKTIEYQLSFVFVE